MTFDLKGNHFKYRILPILNVLPVLSSNIFRHMRLSILNPGGRGLKTEAWNNTKPGSLSEISTYNSSKPGYMALWTDMPHIFSSDLPYFASRTRGFLVPPASDNYTLYLQCDDRCELYFSNTSRPEDKVCSS